MIHKGVAGFITSRIKILDSSQEPIVLDETSWRFLL